jgi:hypothetical protein
MQWYGVLLFDLQTLGGEQVMEALLVGGFEKPGSNVFVNFDGGSDDSLR